MHIYIFFSEKFKEVISPLQKNPFVIVVTADAVD